MKFSSFSDVRFYCDKNNLQPLQTTKASFLESTLASVFFPEKHLLISLSQGCVVSLLA